MFSREQYGNGVLDSIVLQRLAETLTGTSQSRYLHGRIGLRGTSIELFLNMYFLEKEIVLGRISIHCLS